jgi:CRISPR type IV-associated protein Csf3
VSVHKLEVELAAPVAASDPFIHLDSFLTYAAGIEQIGFQALQELDPSSDDPRFFAETMPLKQYRSPINDEWVWACSAAQVGEMDGLRGDDGSWNTTKWRKRFDHEADHQEKDTQVNITTGEFKSYNAALPYNPVDRLQFFFEGDADRVMDLLNRHISGIGKKRSQGFGKIRELSVADVSDHVASAVWNAGRTLRSLPASFLTETPTGIRVERRTVRPPYWHANNQTMAYPPFQDISRDGLSEVLDGG